MKRAAPFLALAVLVAVLTGCPATVQPAAQVEYKTTVIDTSCQTFKLIVVPKAEAPALSDDLSGQILAHDRAWAAKCRAAPAK